MKKSALSAVVAATSCAFAFLAAAQDVPVVLFPFHEATVAAAVDAELKEYHYKLGEPFTNGAVIAELDDVRYRLIYDRARYHRDFAVRGLKEQQELRQKDFASEMELRKAEYEAKQAEADFAEAELNLRRCKFTAPFDGKLAEILTRRFETVKPGQPLYRIIEDRRLLAVANLALGSVAVGDQVRIVPDGLTEVEGWVYEVAPQADNRTGTVRVRVLVDNAKGALTAGMTGVLRMSDTPPKAASEPPRDIVIPFPLRSSGVPYDSVSDAFGKETPFARIVSDRVQLEQLISNRPPVMADREMEILPLKNGGWEVRFQPSLAIREIGFQDGVCAFSLCRYPRAVSLSSLKRVGEVSAGIYSAEGKRLAYVEPRQIELPAAGAILTNAVTFSEGESAAAEAKGEPLKLILRVENDIRALDIPQHDGK